MAKDEHQNKTIIHMLKQLKFGMQMLAQGDMHTQHIINQLTDCQSHFKDFIDGMVLGADVNELINQLKDASKAKQPFDESKLSDKAKSVKYD